MSDWSISAGVNYSLGLQEQLDAACARKGIHFENELGEALEAMAETARQARMEDETYTLYEWAAMFESEW